MVNLLCTINCLNIFVTPSRNVLDPKRLLETCFTVKRISCEDKVEYFHVKGMLKRQTYDSGTGVVLYGENLLIVLLDSNPLPLDYTQK